VKVTLKGVVWTVVLERDDFGMVKSVWSKSLLLRDGLVFFIHGLQEASVTCFGRNLLPSLFMLSGWSSISVASLVMHCMCPDFLARIWVS
jgi:hypothetical protein